ncbi:MAG: LysM peptidoglycan-binding domain-containing protein [Armatimonadetes bacterium]|nr:LysM peptidoglycan-binding domain-containing protein [Akkermansiaceae bacterium]
MKFDRIPTRRKPVRKHLYAQIFNKVKPGKQRAAAAPAADGADEGGINISRSLTIIFAIHIVAIGMIFIHKQYLSGRTPAPSENASSATAKSAKSAAISPVQSNDLPTLSNGDKTYMVRAGDNYTIIARKHEIDESELRNLNRGAEIRPGIVLRVPLGKRIVAEDPPEVAVLRERDLPTNAEQGLVEILPAVESDAPAARVVADAPKAKAVASGRTHTVKSGDNIWRISNTYKVNQKDLMSMNKITDPSKLKIGQLLKLP